MAITDSNVFEPAVVVTLFTVGTLVNRRRRAKDPKYQTDIETSLLPPPSPSRSPSPSVDRFDDKRWVPDNSRFRNNLVSRFLAYFPFLIEIWYWLLTYWVYQGLRAYSAVQIHGDEAVAARAEKHGIQVLSLEHHLGIDIELRLQKFILGKIPWFMTLLSKIYYCHIISGVSFIVYAYTYFPLSTYQAARRTIALDEVFAFIIFTVYRCIPPRMLPEEYGFIDVLHKGPQTAWTDNRFKLLIAAMPSLHFGGSAFIAFCLFNFSPHRPIRYLAPLWPIMMALTIFATANHFVLDAVVGAMIPVVGWRLNEVMLNLRPLEEWGFWLCRTEKPSDNTIRDGRYPLYI